MYIHQPLYMSLNLGALTLVKGHGPSPTHLQSAATVAQEIAMTSVEEDLKLRVGQGDWRPLRVKQFQIFETQPEGEIPDWLHLANMNATVTEKLAPEETDEPTHAEEIEQMHQEGGKHVYQVDEVAEEAESEHDAETSEDTPDWIQCLKGSKFFTLTQALACPFAMHIRDMSRLVPFQFFLMLRSDASNALEGVTNVEIWLHILVKNKLWKICACISIHRYVHMYVLRKIGPLV